MIVDIIRVAECPVAKSRITARNTTMFAAPPSPCNTRPAISQLMLGASAQTTVPAMNSPSPTYKGGFRPA